MVGYPRRSAGPAESINVSGRERKAPTGRQHQHYGVWRGSPRLLPFAIHEPSARRHYLHWHPSWCRHGDQTRTRLSQGWRQYGARHRRSGRAAPERHGSNQRGIAMENQIAVVTGGAQGIGLAVARLLIQKGVLVASWDIDPGNKDAMADRGAMQWQLTAKSTKQIWPVSQSVSQNFTTNTIRYIIRKSYE